MHGDTNSRVEPQYEKPPGNDRCTIIDSRAGIYMWDTESEGNSKPSASALPTCR
jgi:hypothetical protein